MSPLMIDTQTGGQTLDRGGQGALRGAQVALSVERHEVGVDDLCHGSAPLFAEGWLSFSRSFV